MTTKTKTKNTKPVTCRAPALQYVGVGFALGADAVAELAANGKPVSFATFSRMTERVGHPSYFWEAPETSFHKSTLDGRPAYFECINGAVAGVFACRDGVMGW